MKYVRFVGLVGGWRDSSGPSVAILTFGSRRSRWFLTPRWGWHTRGVLTTVFVYGTLMPGHLRWGLIAPFAVSHQAATARGQLYDTGKGWPAARFVESLDHGDHAGPGTPVVHGWLVELTPASASILMGQLDDVEGAVAADENGLYPDAGPGGAVPEYRRVQIQTTDGAKAWAYQALGIGSGWTTIDQWTGQREN